MKAMILGFGLFTFGLFIFRGDDEIMSANHSSLQLIGETVTVSYVANPSVGHGQFRLNNHGTVTVIADVESTWLEIGGHRQTLVGVTVFDRDQERMVNPSGFKVDASATLRFMVGFPKVDYEPRFGESSAIGIRLRVNGNEVQALSPIKFERRIPYGL